MARFHGPTCSLRAAEQRSTVNSRLMPVLQLRSNVLAKTFYLRCNTGITRVLEVFANFERSLTSTGGLCAWLDEAGYGVNVDWRTCVLPVPADNSRGAVPVRRLQRIEHAVADASVTARLGRRAFVVGAVCAAAARRSLLTDVSARRSPASPTHANHFRSRDAAAAATSSVHPARRGTKPT